MIIDTIVDSELKLFVESVRHYFKKITKKETEITSAYLGTNHIKGYEFNGIVNFSGSYQGQIIVSMPRQLLRELLIMQEETELSDNNLLDIVGEIANTLAGNSRKKLISGSNLNISVPRKFKGNTPTTALTQKHPYLITLSWMNSPALICIDLAKTAN